ncbi:MAG: DNA-deoxyinosine glycosylase [Eubacterium sp.]
MSNVYTRASHGFGPIYDEKSRILILGSFPSVKSREEGFFYGHPRNRFWKILTAVLKEQEPVTIQKKKEMLLQYHIALYDVIEECEIVGSSDSSIRNVVPADLKQILEAAQITEVFTNGRLAGKLYRRYQEPVTGIPCVELPSSSPANAAFSLEKLTAIWQEALPELRKGV